MSRIARFLAGAGERTLVLLDELGSGTDPAEGAALGRAILDYLHSRRVPTLVTTHLGSLKTYAFTHRGASNASVEFDVETLSPTYRLLIGQPGASNALTIAERLGVPREVTARALDLVKPTDREGLEILQKAQEIRSEAERHLREAEGRASRSKDLERMAVEERKEAEQRRRHVEAEAEDEMDEALSRVRKILLDLSKEMGNAPKPFAEKARAFVDRAEKEVRATPLIQRREEYARSLHRGDEVFVPRLNERFRVHQVRKKDRKLTLIKGNLRIEVDFADVTWV
jgi:DNA mismatch repair protein MutS2